MIDNQKQPSAKIIPVILAGGSGTRLWPLSRALFPKQLLPLAGDLTMLQETVQRLAGIRDIGSPLVLCNEEQRFMVAELLQEIKVKAAIILEPVGRNTAPAVAVAALEAMAGGDDAILLVLPADHVIRDTRTFATALEEAGRQARTGKLITFGITPDRPETGYGYIKRKPMPGSAPEMAAGGPPLAFPVERFVEKPDASTAERYVASGEYFWNSGMFMMRASTFLAELEQFAPAMLAACRLAHEKRQRDLDFIRLDRQAFSEAPADSIDYAVMEKTSLAMVIPLACGWSDVGSWTSLWEIGAKDLDNNVLSGPVITKDVSNCYIRAGDRLVAAVGLRDHIVVETTDAVLVAPMDRAQDVKAIVQQLQAEQREEAILHRRVFRPWGSYECVDRAARFQVKRIVVKGTAKITNGEQVLILTENQSTYIPIGAGHRLENPGTIPLELIEVQSGSYLGEDDIVRFEDIYGRAEKKSEQKVE